MAKIAQSLTELVGNTPILELKNYEEAKHLPAHLLAKLEYFNPLGSVKDRVAEAMIEQGIKDGLINDKTVIIEPTSGNTGIGLAFVCAAKKLHLILTMPDTMSAERRNLLKALGARLVLTPGAEGMKGAIAKAQDLAATTPGSFIPSQFTNPTNPRAHYETTGGEIWEDTDGEVDIVVAGVGTGGTITGIGRLLKERKPGGITVIAVEPADSPVLSAGQAGSHQIQGIGAGFIPETLDTDIYDEVITVSNEDAFSTAKELGVKEGILTGISSGAALWAAVQVAKRKENTGKNVVVILPDSADRYYSTPLFI